MEILKIAALTVMLFLIERSYLWFADKRNIIDKPNMRSSHETPVARGGGILFPATWLLFSVWNGFAFPWFTAGLILIAVVSFVDDLDHLSPLIRFIAHLAAFTLCFTEIGVWQDWAWWAIPVAYILCIGAINAFNFMDGINGITGMYAIAALLPMLLFRDKMLPQGADPLSTPVIPILISIIVFGYFNFRKKARCFAGDVGSISLGFILIFLLMLMMTGQEERYGLDIPSSSPFEWKYILFMSLYGVDSALTIMQRLYLRENIFEAHRRHLFQYLANERKLPHLVVAFSYAALQLLINLHVISEPITPLVFFLILASLALIWVVLKFRVLREAPDRSRTVNT